MPKSKLSLLFTCYCLLFTFLISSCNKTETYPSKSLEEYYPLTSGKYIIYQLDSLKYISFGTRDTIISCEVKYQTDTIVTDNLGRKAWRIFRYIRKDNNHSWIPDATFMAVSDAHQIEFIENNLRFIKLRAPLENDFSWKGNVYIDTYSANSELKYLDNWDYTYTDLGHSENIGGIDLSDLITVNQRDEVIGDPNDSGSYSEINFGQEKYAKGIGMVYKKFFHREYQPGNGGYTADGSYGITLTLIDHN